MTLQNPKDPRQATPGDDYRRDGPLDVELQADPELREGAAGPGRIVIYAAAIAVLLGAVFYGLNSTSTTTTATNPSPASTASNSGFTSPTPPNVRDVTPNRENGITTGAAPSQPINPQSKPTGTEVDRSKGPANQ